MRTTVDIDDRVLAVARSRARTHRITLGRAISELALKGYEAQEAEVALGGDDFPMLPEVDGHVITDDMVERALVDDA